MRKFLALLVLSLSLFAGGWGGIALAEKNWGVAPNVGGDHGYKGDGLLSYTEFISGGSYGWGGVAPGEFDHTQIGHEQGVPRLWTPLGACTSVEPVIHLIEVSREGPNAPGTFWRQMVMSGECKDFPMGLKFWPDEVVAEMKWSDGDLMYVVRGHDSKDVILYTWTLASLAGRFGVPPPGASSALPSI